MKRTVRMAGFLMLAAAVLTSFAAADFGPKDELTVRFLNAPECGYYLDLLEEGEYEKHGDEDPDTYRGIEWNYPDEMTRLLDEAFLEEFREAVPEGWHACTAEGPSGAPMMGDLLGRTGGWQGERTHTFSYFGVPETYRVMVLSREGEVWITESYTRQVLQSSVTVDWEARSVYVPPTMAGYAVQFLATLLPTLLIEGVLLLAFGYSWRRNWRVFLAVNLLTQGALTAWCAWQVVTYGANRWFLFPFFIAEVVIAAAEVFLYRRWLTGQSKGRAVLYALAANLCSCLLGGYLMEPVWLFVRGLL